MACEFWDVQCKAEEGITNLAGSAVEQFVQALADGCKLALGFVNTFWMEVPSPTVATGSGQSWQGSGVVTGLQHDLMPITATVAIIAFALALLRIAFSPERAGEGIRSILRQFVAVLAATLPILAVSQLLIGFGDQFSPWIIQKATGEPASEGFENVLIEGIFGPGVPDSGLGLWLVLFLVGIFGSAVQCAFMVFRGAAILILFVLLPPVAAGAATEDGWQRYKKMLMIILGFVLYKPVAAVIYATGLKLMSAQGDDQVMNAIYGLTVIFMAALALPAMIKFLLPTAAVGSSSAFSGGAAVGAVAGGAAVVGLAAATGGVGAAGGAATASGAGSAGAGGTAAATEGGGAAGGAAGGTAGPGGGSGSGSGPVDGASSGPGAPGAGGGEELVGADAGGSSSASGGSAGGASSSTTSATETSSSTGSGSDSASGAESTSTQSGESTSAPSPSSNPAAQGATSQSTQRHGEAVRQLAQDASERVQRAGNEAAEGADQ